MAFVIYIMAHVSAPPSPCDHFSIYILLYLFLPYAIIHELMEIKLIKSMLIVGHHKKRKKIS